MLPGNAKCSMTSLADTKHMLRERKIDSAGGGGRRKRRGLGPRNDVLTTCKAVTLRGGQWIITVFFPQ